MLELVQISKSFPGVQALTRVSMLFRAGEVHALCGENGAGKSTLMNIIAGNIQPDDGKVVWNDNEVRIENYAHARQLGISIVYQEGSLGESMSVAENIFAEHQPLNRFGLIDYGRLYKDARTLLAELNVDIDPRTKVSQLAAEQKKLVEIAKALAGNPSLLILDEPTAAITNDKVERLFDIICSLKMRKVAVIYISHRMDEILKIADTVSVLKDGIFQGTIDPAVVSTADIIRMMVGRELRQSEFTTSAQPHPLLQIRNLDGRGFKNVSFDIHRGEIFGLAGLHGSGRTALARTIFGDLRAAQGEIMRNGALVKMNSPAEAMRQGVAYVPEDRKSGGLFIERSVAENISITAIRNGWYNNESVATVAQEYIRQLGIKTSSPYQPVKMLSGGNQQKVVLAKWLSIKPDVLVVNEPTHGVDVGAKSEIYRLLRQFTSAGRSILLISSDLPELLLLCDRIGVMYMGELKKIVAREQFSEELITSIASGLSV